MQNNILSYALPETESRQRMGRLCEQDVPHRSPRGVRRIDRDRRIFEKLDVSTFQRHSRPSLIAASSDRALLYGLDADCWLVDLGV